MYVYKISNNSFMLTAIANISHLGTIREVYSIIVASRALANTVGRCSSGPLERDANGQACRFQNTAATLLLACTYMSVACADPTLS